MISIFRGRRSGASGGNIIKWLVLGSIGLIFWGGLFGISLKVLKYFQGIEEIGIVLGYKLLSMILVTSFALLVFSSILTHLSKLYLSRDLNLVHSLPVSRPKVFIARWLDSTFDSTWMVIVYTLPVFISYGIVYKTGMMYYLYMGAALLSLALTASSISSLLVVLSVIIIPANRVKSIFIFMSLFFFVSIYLAFRFLKPELLVDPEVFDSVLLYVSELRMPESSYLPTTWAFDAVRAGLTGRLAEGVFHLSLSWSFTGLLVCVIVVAADVFYYEGYSKTQTAHVRLLKNNSGRMPVFNILPKSVKAFAEKEVKTFFRDQTQWTQIFLIIALIVIYIYNFKVLPLEKSPIKTIYLQNLLSFLNMGLALFVLTAIAARFAYPAISVEKNAFWIAKASPCSLKKVLWTKFFIYYLPLLFLALILIVASNIMLQVSTFMMILSIANTIFLVPGIIAMGVGLGAAYPDFKAENPTQTVTSFGGFLYMVLCAGFIGLVILLEAGPVYRIFMAGVHQSPLTTYDWIWISGSFFIAFMISVLAIFLPMWFGEKRLSIQAV